jgi:phospholipase/carboxylesterase
LQLRTKTVFGLGITVIVAALVWPATVEELSREGLERLQAGDPAGAREAYLVALEADPENVTVLYNLACCESLLGNLAASRNYLVDAWNAGFRDIGMIKRDPDLTELRESKKGRQLLKELEDAIATETRRFGVPQLFEAPVLGTSRVIPPPEPNPDRRYPLVVLLHGYGATADAMVGMFTAAGISPSYFVAAPYGPYAVPQGVRIGYSWFPPPHLYEEVVRGFGGGEAGRERARLLNLHEQGVSVAYVLAAVDRMIAEHRVDPARIVLIGHSQGGALGYRVALEHADRFLGLVVVGSRLRKEEGESELLAGAAGRLKVLVCHSPEDEAVSIEHGKQAYRALKKANVEVGFARYSGGHGLSVELIRTVNSWVEKVVAPR